MAAALTALRAFKEDWREAAAISFEYIKNVSISIYHSMSIYLSVCLYVCRCIYTYIYMHVHVGLASTTHRDCESSAVAVSNQEAKPQRLEPPLLKRITSW